MRRVYLLVLVVLFHAKPVVGGSVASSLPATLVAPLVLDGYCPVALHERMIWRRGDAKLSEVYRGHTYYFATPEAREKFRRAPDDFRPLLSGNDPYLFVTKGILAQGKREHGIMRNNLAILFATSEAKEQFFKDPQHYVDAVEQRGSQDK